MHFVQICPNQYLSTKINYIPQPNKEVWLRYIVVRAREAGYKRLVVDMLGFANLMSRPPQGWGDKSENIKDEIIREKFGQNENLMGKLEQSSCTEFYEMTTDSRWGTGTRLPHVTKAINPNQSQNVQRRQSHWKDTTGNIGGAYGYKVWPPQSVQK